VSITNGTDTLNVLPSELGNYVQGFGIAGGGSKSDTKIDTFKRKYQNFETFLNALDTQLTDEEKKISNFNGIKTSYTKWGWVQDTTIVKLKNISLLIPDFTVAPEKTSSKKK
jgi:hypothetical protein